MTVVLSPLGELTTLLKRGITPSYADSGIPVVNQKCVRDHRVNLALTRITDPKKRRIPDEKVLQRWDVLINSTGVGTLGRVAPLRHAPPEPTTFDTHVTVARPNPNLVDGQYFGYAVEYRETQIEAMGAGATGQTELSRHRLAAEVLLPVPDRASQRKIATVLSAYDDLIANNTRRIAILEEMARTIYREWFVEFRYPGHEGAPLVESELGPIPSGWTPMRLDEVADLYRGRSYRSSNLVEDGGWLFVNLKCFVRDGGFRSSGLKRYDGPLKEHQKAVAGDMVIALTDMTQDRRIVARAARVPDLGVEEFAMSMDVLKVIPSGDVPTAFLYGMLRYSSFSDEVKEYANGANVLHLSPDRIGEYTVVLPPTSLQDAYASIAENIEGLRDVLSSQNRLLERTRDLLLPRLVSGEVDVSDLDIDVGVAL